MAKKNLPLLRNGSRGEDVKEVQVALTEAGYDVGKAGADGVIGPDTVKAIKQFQKDNGLAVDGIVGPQTRGKLPASPKPTMTGTKPNLVTIGDVDNRMVQFSGDGQAIGTPPAEEAPKGETPKGETPSGEAPKGETPSGEAPATTGSPSYGSFTYDDFSYGDFTYDDYAQSEIVKQANALLQQQQANKPGAYQSQWQSQIDEYMNKIMNRDPFSYNFNEDALYHQYKDIYTQNGLMAMMDTMGQAAAMTGGYGNSYAQTVGQQAYNQQLSQLNNVLPELYQMAFDRYAYEGDQLQNQYGMLMDRENMDYGKYMDAFNIWQSERDYLAGRYDSERDYDYGKYIDDRKYAYDKYSDDRKYAYDEWSSGRELAYDDYVKKVNMAYQQERDAVEDAQWQAEFDEKNRQFNVNQTNETSTTTDGTDVPGYDNGDVSADKVKLIQEALGVTADGKWGPNSSDAANGMTAEEAWEAYMNGKFDKEDAVDETGLTTTRKDQIYDWLEGVFTNPHLSASFDPNKLIKGSSYLTSDAERNYAMEIINFIATQR